jgi:hypothetical protein
MESEPNKPSQPATITQKLSYYLLVGSMIAMGIYFLLQGISQFR